MKHDIVNRADIELLVDSFYQKVNTDPIIGFIFSEIAKVNWAAHLPVMVDFWEHTLLYAGSYTGNPMQLHQQLHNRFPLTAQHFEQWNKLFAATVDELYHGEKAELAKQRALSISTLMRIKLAGIQSGLL